MHGHGVMTWPDRGRYEGQFDRGKKHGLGIHRRTDGSQYVGEYKEGREWNGVVYLASGEIDKTVTNGTFKSAD